MAKEPWRSIAAGFLLLFEFRCDRFPTTDEIRARIEHGWHAVVREAAG